MSMSDRMFIEEYTHFWNIGYDVYDIADIFGVQAITVGNRAERLGLPRWRGADKRTADLVDQAVEAGGPVVVELLPEQVDITVAKSRIKYHVDAGRVHPKPRLIKSYKRRKPPMAWDVVQ